MIGRRGEGRVHVLLRREGWRINQKKTRRIYRELGLQLRNKTPKRRVKAKLRDDRKATRPNETWAMDFVHDQLATGRKIRVLTVVDTFTRFSPAIDPRFSYRGEDVVQVLERVCSQLGYPATIRVDQGTEFVSRDLDLWAYTRGVVLDFSRPGKPTDNAFIEAFNGRFRAECLNAHWFMSREDARQKMEAWRRYYNEERPHGAIGQKAPITLLVRDGMPSPPS
jgi:putative transposase